jgi:hypothetical protein
MLISADLSDELAIKIDALVEDLPEPTWPFPTKNVAPGTLTRSQQERYKKYQEDYAAYEASRRDGTRLRSRSAVIKMIIADYFNRNGNGSAKP